MKMKEREKKKVEEIGSEVRLPVILIKVSGGLGARV